MSLPFAAAIFLVIWWTVLFAVLPFEARRPRDASPSVAGGDEGAPAAPRIGRTVLTTTLVSVAIFALVYALIVHRVLPLDAIPFGPRFSD